jgi:hypothetical protein
MQLGVVASAGLAEAKAAFAGPGAPVVPSVRDLGVDVCWGRRRQQTRRQRVDKAKQQSYRAGRLPAGAAFKRQVAAAMMVARAAWGAAVDGLTASAARVLRTAVHRALTRGVGARRAVEVDLALHGGPSGGGGHAGGDLVGRVGEELARHSGQVGGCMGCGMESPRRARRSTRSLCGGSCQTSASVVSVS